MNGTAQWEAVKESAAWRETLLPTLQEMLSEAQDAIIYTSDPYRTTVIKGHMEILNKIINLPDRMIVFAEEEAKKNDERRDEYTARGNAAHRKFRTGLTAPRP